MRKYNLLILALVSAVILAISWPSIGDLSPLLLVAFVPLLFLEEIISKNKNRYKNYHLFNYSYLAFFTWNLLTTWWVYFADLFGVVTAIVFNSLFMAIVFLLFHISKKQLGAKVGYSALIFFWLAFEYLHLNWDLSWPWLTLGNGFAKMPQIVQWYEFTGVLGGSLWILVSNILAFRLIRKFVNNEKQLISVLEVAKFAVVLLVPILFSLKKYYNYEEKKNPVNVVVVQPNIDPYEKFKGISPDEQLEELLILANKKLDSTVKYLVFPETALPHGIWEREIHKDYPVMRIREFLKKYPNLKLVTGLSSFKAFKDGEALSSTARKHKSGGGYYDAYNTAMQLDSSTSIQLYHKSKLVPGAEQTPFPSIFGHLEFLAVNLGGIVGSLGTDPERKVFTVSEDTFGIAPVICYESVYGEYVGEYIQKGANLIFIITNDGWWENTPGYKQHMNYARLRAIESRRSIARSANTGISCFINQRGDIQECSEWWEPAVLKKEINASSELTFYSKYGDYIGRTSAFFAILLLALTIAKRLNKTQQRLGF